MKTILQQLEKGQISAEWAQEMILKLISDIPQPNYHTYLPDEIADCCKLAYAGAIGTVTTLLKF